MGGFILLRMRINLAVVLARVRRLLVDLCTPGNAFFSIVHAQNRDFQLGNLYIIRKSEILLEILKSLVWLEISYALWPSGGPLGFCSGWVVVGSEIHSHRVYSNLFLMSCQQIKFPPFQGHVLYSSFEKERGKEKAVAIALCL